MNLSGYRARSLATLFQAPPERYDRNWAVRFIEQLGRVFGDTVRTTEAAPFVLLRSPSAKVFRVTVSDTGVLTATEIPQGDPTV